MDPLEEQLAQLNLLNSRGGVGQRSAYSPAGEGLPLYHQDELGKKLGPLVPPKPEKKTLNSFLGESLYGSNKDLKPSPPPLVSRQSADIYHKTSKETLDNPAVLEQKLEALAYHKQQLEKKKSLNQQSSFDNIPKLSSSSLVYKQGLRPKPQQQQPLTSNAIYSNYQVTKNPTPIPNANPLSSSSPSASPLPLSSPGLGQVAQTANIYGNIIQKSLNQSKGIESMSSSGSSNRPAPKPLNMNNYKIYCNVPFEKESKLEMNASSAIIPNSVPLTTQMLSMQSNDDDFAREQEDLPPPSPVSSSYSELRRATNIFQNNPSAVTLNNGLNLDKTSPNLHYVTNKNNSNVLSSYGEVYMDNSSNNEFSNYSLNTEGAGSSTYESIYEPINPRPPSQLSARFNYLNYSPYENAAVIAENNAALLNHSNFSSLPRNTYPDPHSNHDPKHPHKKNDLNNYLEPTIEDESTESEGYGVCFKCNQRVIDETSGCTAMDQIYHIACFTCFQCQINLQGKPFYGIDGKPYCEYDYLQTLEKCSVCMKPILERILRATGKPYHPQCFTCVVCGNSLDGIPFTVDATNQNYCIEDFHKKFAPRCCVCKEPIMPEPGEEETVRVVALDRSFHLQCYKCEDCGLLLSSEAEGRGCYPLDDHVLCKSCNARRVQLLTNRMTTEL